MADVYSLDDLEACVRKMRALGVTKYRDIELGPEPPTEIGETQRTTVTDDTVKAQRAEVQRRAFAASGGPVKSAGRTQ